MKHFLFTPNTCFNIISKFITQIFQPLEEVRISANIFCSGDWLDKLSVEIDSKRNYIYLDSLKLESEEETIAFKGLFNRAILNKVTLVISLKGPLESGLKNEIRENIIELTAN